MPQIADTGYLVAFWSKSDAHHKWARSLEVRAPLLTCEAVLMEASYLLGSAEPLLQMLVDGDLALVFDLKENATHLMRWMEKFADLDPGPCGLMRGATRRTDATRRNTHYGSSRFQCLSDARWEAIALCVSACQVILQWRSA